MAFVLEGKSYTKPEFWRLLTSVRQVISFNEVPKRHRARLLDGDSIEIACRRYPIYTRKRDGMVLAVTA